MTSYKTPDIPDRIRAIRHPMFKNIYEFSLGNKNLWGTESLLGDWDGTHLLIAKDFYPSSYIEQALDRGQKYPYQHNPDAPTNKNLRKTLKCFGKYHEGTSNTECGFLYVSACFLLRADGAKRGKLPDEAKALELSWPVLQFTINNMPHIKHVVLMGNEARRALRLTPLQALLQQSGYQLHFVSHPANAMTDRNRFAEWEPIFRSQR